MLLESLQQTVSLAVRNRFAEYVLLDGMRPLGHVQGRHPQRRPRAEPALDFRCVPIREIEGYKKRSVSVDGHWDGRCDGRKWRLNSDRVLQLPHRLRAKCGRQKFPCARPRNPASRRAAEAILREQCGL